MFSIELLAKHHDKNSFDCGNEPLNAYLKTMASQHSKKGLSKTYVLAKDNQILGFYSIVAGAYHHEKIIQGYPNVIPCILLGRLAVDKMGQGQGLSHYLIIHAIETIKRLSNDVGIAIILVHLKGLYLVDFYKKFGFKQTEQDSLTMYLKVNSI